jgi:hypothetical protein
MPLKDGAVMRIKCPCELAPVKKKNDIIHVTKRKLVNIIINILFSFKKFRIEC